VSLRPRHRYAADLPGGLPVPGSEHAPEVPATCSPAGRTAPGPDPPGSSRRAFEGRNNAGSSRTPFRHTRRTRTIWRYWHAPALSGLLPPSPAPPRSGCPQLHRPAATGQRRRSFTSTRTNSASRRNSTHAHTSPAETISPTRRRRCPRVTHRPARAVRCVTLGDSGSRCRGMHPAHQPPPTNQPGTRRNSDADKPGILPSRPLMSDSQSRASL
jgi:hypothetical protein